MTKHEADFISDDEFSAEERKAFRRLMQDYNRGRWFGRVLARWGAWAMGFGAGLVFFKEQIATFLGFAKGG